MHNVSVPENYPAAVKPDVAQRQTPPPPGVIDRLNVRLSEPWSQVDRAHGRTFPVVAVGAAHVEFVVEYFTRAGWYVERESEHLRFRGYRPSPGGYLDR